VYIDGLDQVPLDKPLILASNHQSAFIEPVLLGGIMPFPVHFITRGDIFVKRWMWFFNAVNMVPIFRFHDGFSQMKKNMDSFQHVYDALGKGARVIIFCEGQMRWKKQLQPLQLGAARMALGSYVQNPEMDIHIVPIGINYENHLKFRRYVKISFGQAIRVADHAGEIEKSIRPGLKSITEELSQRIKPQVIHIATDTHYDLGNDLLSVNDNNRSRAFFPFYEINKQVIQESIQAAKNAAKLDTNEKLRSTLIEYKNKLGNPLSYRDYVLAHQKEFNASLDVFFRIFISPIAFLGILLNGLPIYIANKITLQKTKVPEFIGSLKSNLGAIFYLLYAFILIVGLTFYCWHLGLFGFILLVVTGLFATYYWDRKDYWRAAKYLKHQSAETIADLKSLRESIQHQTS
jgi:1-acyl-sn-glycerol-3-phosphate acyltransferase